MIIDNEFGNNYGGDDDEAAAWGECDKALERTGSGVFLKLPDDGCRADVAFLGAPRPRDFVPKDPRAGEDGPKTYFDFNVFCFTTGRGKGEDVMVGLVKVWSMNPSTFKQVRTFAENFPAFRTTQFRIVRSGEKGNSKTTYAIMPLGPISAEWQAFIAAQPLHKIGTAYDAARAAQTAAGVPAPRPAPMAPPPRPGPPAPPVAPMAPAPAAGGWSLAAAGATANNLPTATVISKLAMLSEAGRASAMVWREGLPGWVPVGQVPELAPPPAPPAPPAPPRPAGPPPMPAAPAGPPAMPAMPSTPAMEVNAATLAALQSAPTEETLKAIMGAATASTTDATILAAYTSAYKVRLFDLTGEMPF